MTTQQIKRNWKPSTAQEKVLQDMAAGQTLIRAFDVWRGYWWYLQPSGRIISPITGDILLRKGAIVPGENKRIFSGYHEQPHTRAA